MQTCCRSIKEMQLVDALPSRRVRGAYDASLGV